jgi:hypothetical protein
VAIDAHWVSFSTKKKTGRITIANACMQLPIDALAMGFSTKEAHGAHNQRVGRHGQGLTLAALVLSRNRYDVSITRLVAIGGLKCVQTLLRFLVQSHRVRKSS